MTFVAEQHTDNPMKSNIPRLAGDLTTIQYSEWTFGENKSILDCA